MNPFHHRGPVTDPAHFFGRRREMDAVLSRTAHASKPQCVSLVGLRRIGKSSLLRQISDVRGPELARQSPPMVAVYESLEGAGNLTVDRFFATLLRKVARQLRKLEVEAPRVPEVTSGGDAEQTFCDWMEDLSDDGHRIVLLLDEFDVVTMNPAFDAAVFGRLRYLASSLCLAYVTSSYAQLSDLCHRDEIRQSPFFNIFSSTFLGLLTDSEAEEILLVESERAGARFHAEEVAFLMELAGTHPFHLQQAASALWEAQDPGKSTAIKRAFLEEAEPHFEYTIRHLPEGQRNALVAVASGCSFDPESDGDASALVRRGLVRESGGRFMAFSETFAEWLRSQDTIERKRATTAPGTPTAEVTGRGSSSHDLTSTLKSPPRAGNVLEDRWVLEREVGRGGFGVVYAATDRTLGRQVAVKVLHAEKLADTKGRHERERFLREARTAARITHPNVVVVHDVRDQPGAVFIVMELFTGRSLRELLDERPRLPVDEALDIVIQAADGVAAAHELDIIHRDIKPDNLVLDQGGRIKVVDFGLAWLLGEARLTSQSGALMTPRYCSPEQIQGRDVGKATDVFSLGCVLYEAVTGRRAFEGTTITEVIHRILYESPPDLDVDLPEPSEGLRRLLSRCLARRADARPADAIELGKELRELRAR